MMESDHDIQRRRYRLCMIGFGLTAVSILLLAVDSTLNLGLRLSWMRGQPAPWAWALNSPAYSWLIGAPITWMALLGTYLLWGRWDDPSWQRRAGLLVVMNLVDSVLWAIDRGPELGLMAADAEHLWFRIKLAQALGWAEFALIAGLAADLAVHLGVPHAADSGKTTRSLVAVGALSWMYLFIQGTNWGHPFWPLEPRLRVTPGLFMFSLANLFIQTIVAFQVASLSFLAASRCRHVLAEIDREEHANDPLKSRSEESGLPLEPAFQEAF
ncbi:hypothetical protein EP7_005040 [Isosphaeraceae bacterium EP7]